MDKIEFMCLLCVWFFKLTFCGIQLRCSHIKERPMNMLWLNACQAHLKIIVTYKLIMWVTSRCVCRTHGYVLMCVGAAILGVDGVKVHNENSNMDIPSQHIILTYQL